MSKTLLVIDMQSGFSTSNSARTINNCIREIRKAKENGDKILFVEFDTRTFNTTLNILQNEVLGYHNFGRVDKYEDSAYSALMSMHYLDRDTEYVIVGVNTQYCVYKTATQLHNNGYQVHVVLDATNSQDEYYIDQVFKAYENQPKFRVSNKILEGQLC